MSDKMPFLSCPVLLDNWFRCAVEDKSQGVLGSHTGPGATVMGHLHTCVGSPGSPSVEEGVQNLQMQVQAATQEFHLHALTIPHTC